MNLRQLRYFTRIVETGNITRAAEQLYVAQPALGMQVRQLEQDYGVSLLVRHPRGVRTTRAGQLLYERACEILRLVDDTERLVKAQGRFEMEAVMLGLTNGFMNIVGRDLILLAKKELPGVKLGVVEERSIVLIDALERHEIDLALAYEVHERPGMIRVPLLEEEMLFVYAAENGNGRLHDTPVTFSEMAKHELVLPGLRDGVREQLFTAAKRRAIELNVILDVSSVSMMKRMVAAGDAAAVMPYGNAIEHIELGLLNGRRIADPALSRTLYLVRSITRASFKHEEALIDLLAQIVQMYISRLGSLANRCTPAADLLSNTVATLRDEYRAPR
ncbi:LysR family transcriptional regulator [Advenella mimigardefordensis]|uniref:Transcriptional regulator, LysR family n=1 Tax=Advenella mimigardefordensis (strain DSM 17166 / LMG 22922 / DPN7) TaxID=1247726 RepID=W0P5W3_ADVMD|nr:LysR family transcriptional regulator [Advenella mimigardefordensis]AHG62239.1 transcriptional regulator, LysR family [Advenella mimigardefordensis DPN7]